MAVECIEDGPPIGVIGLPDSICGQYDLHHQHVEIDSSKSTKETFAHELYHHRQRLFFDFLQNAGSAFYEAAAYFAGADYAYFSGRMGNPNYLDESASEEIRFAVISNLCARFPESFTSGLIRSAVAHAVENSEVFCRAVLEDASNIIRATETQERKTAFVGNVIALLAFAANDFDFDKTYDVLESTPDEVLDFLANANQENIEKVICMVDVIFGMSKETQEQTNKAFNDDAYLVANLLSKSMLLKVKEYGKFLRIIPSWSEAPVKDQLFGIYTKADERVVVLPVKDDLLCGLKPAVSHHAASVI